MTSSVLKGIVVGVGNVVAVAVGLGLTQGSLTDNSQLVTVVCVLGVVPGIIAGAAIGYLAGRLAILRRLTLASLAVFAVVVLGLLIEPAFIWFASIPTIVAALALERWTRANLGARARPPGGLLSSTSKGALLGICNVAVTAVLVGVMVALDPPMRGWAGDGETLGFGSAPYVKGSALGIQIAILVAFAGLLPGLVTGVGLGRLADQLRPWSSHARLAVVAAIAVTVVAVLGLLTRQTPLIVPACGPALIASFGLERWTRETRQTLPRAVARRC